MQDHMKKDLNLKPHHQKLTNELSVIDMYQLHDTCHAMLDPFPNATS
jgi:hypothetical protein